MFCRLCASIFEGDIEVDKLYDHYASAAELRRSAALLCHMCCIVERHLNADFRDTWEANLSHLEFSLRMDIPEKSSASDSSATSGDSDLPDTYSIVFPAFAPKKLIIVCQGLDLYDNGLDYEVQINLHEAESMYPLSLTRR